MTTITRELHVFLNKGQAHMSTKTQWTVIPDFEIPDFAPRTEIGPFTTYEAAREFATIRCVMQAHICECRNVRVIEDRKITEQEYENRKHDPAALIDPSEF
jgi:hypothetical protein